MGWTGFVLALASAFGQEPAQEDGLAAQVTAILVRAEEPDDATLKRDARELAALSDVTPLLMEVVGRGRTPEPDDARLAPRQLELAREALHLAGGERLTTFLREVQREPGSPERLTVALRIVARRSSRDAIVTLTGLARAAEKKQLFPEIEGAFEESLAELLARDPSRVRRLAAPFSELSPAAAAIAVRVVGATGSSDGLACLQSQLGHRGELDGPLLLELGRLAHLIGGAESQDLAVEVMPYLRSRAIGEVQAAATLLGRLCVPATVPALIEGLVDENPGTVRAALAALRAIGGVSLPASPELWRSWYGREETWWQERAAELFGPPSVQDEDQALAEISARLREVSEHRLHRHELVARLTPLLVHPRERVRVMVCQCLGRLGSSDALQPLRARLTDASGEVVAAAQAALDQLAGERADRPRSVRAARSTS